MQRRARLLALVVAASAVATLPATAQTPPPQTGMEANGFTDWTTHEEELDFLAAVDELSDRVEIEVILDETLGGRPMHLVKIGHPRPFTVKEAQDLPVELHVCTQHGNEPAGREACLIAIRDLAFTDDPALVAQLGAQATIFVPTVNPDGRANNSRTNASGSDLNRQHLQVDQPEVRAVGRVVRDWKPVMNMDHHEYGPSIPGVYDDDILVLWPRNLNVHKPLQDLARSFSQDHVVPCLEQRTYSTDEYGQYSVSTPLADVDAHQSAGDWDDGISRNAAGLRHSLGILAESAVSANPRHPAEAIAVATNPSGALGNNPATMQRRVISQVALIECTLEWMRDNGAEGYRVTRESMAAKALEGRARSAPTYFDGQDEDPTLTGIVTGDNQPQTLQDPPFCGFLLGEDQVDLDVEEALDVHGIASVRQADGSVFVSMAQEAEPVIGLLFDERGERHLVAAEGLDDCAPFEVAAAPDASPEPEAAPEPAPLPVTGGGIAVLGLLALAGASSLRRD